MWLHHLFRPLTNDTIFLHIEYDYINYSWLTTFPRCNPFTTDNESNPSFFSSSSMVHHYYYIAIPPIYLPHKTFHRFCLALFSFRKQFAIQFTAFSEIISVRQQFYMFAIGAVKKVSIKFSAFLYIVGPLVLCLFFCNVFLPELVSRISLLYIVDGQLLGRVDRIYRQNGQKSNFCVAA